MFVCVCVCVSREMVSLPPGPERVKLLGPVIDLEEGRAGKEGSFRCSPCHKKKMRTHSSL